jgi:Fic family protein
MSEVSLPRGQRIFVETSIANQLIEYALPSLLSDISIGPCTHRPAIELEYDRSLTLIASSPLSDTILSERAYPWSEQMRTSTLTGKDIATARFTRDLIQSHAASPISEITLRTINGTLRGLPNPSATPFRSVLTWVAGQTPATAALVPAPPAQIEEYLADLVAFLRRDDVPESLAQAMAYYQFLTIHPFKDANGRVARLLVALQSCRRQGASAQGIILAAGLSARREVAARFLRGAFDGNWDSYLAFWATLERWCTSVAEFAVRSLCRTRAVLRERLDSVKWKESFTALAELAPHLSYANFNAIVRGSDRLTRRYLSSLQEDRVIRRLEGRDEEWECLDAAAHWERVRNFAATTIAELRC